MSKPTLDAFFQPQAWVNDDAVDSAPGEAFDAADAVLSLTAAELRHLDGEMRRPGRDLDVLAERAGLVGTDGAHDGPFYVDVEVSDWDGFLEATGLDPRTTTDADIAAVRDGTASPTPR